MPKSPNTISKVKVTFRSKLAVLVDYSFIGKAFDEIKLKNVPLNVNYSVTNFTVTESFWGTKFIGDSNDFISDKFGGILTRLDLTDCWRNHVYREYDHNIASCETCNITRCCRYETKAINPTTRVVFVCHFSLRYMHIIFGRGEDDTLLLLFRNNKVCKIYVGDKYLYDKLSFSRHGKFLKIDKYFEEMM